ncbi:hypothetical protein DW201_17410, partial [Enterococcus casseliflavus]
KSVSRKSVDFPPTLNIVEPEKAKQPRCLAFLWFLPDSSIVEKTSVKRKGCESLLYYLKLTLLGSNIRINVCGFPHKK